MKISLIAAVAKNNVIGKDGKIPWHIKEDLRRFKKITQGHHILMGRKTFESIGKPLPERINLILTSDKNYKVEGAFTFNTIKDACDFSRENKEKELMVIGGSSLYKHFIKKADKIYLTRIFKNYNGDTFFPKINFKEWKISFREKYKKENPPFEFIDLERKKRRPLVIGITGTNGAGKGTVVEYLVKEKGFVHFSVSSYLTQVLKDKNKEINRDNMREIANKIREKFGAEYVVKILFNKAIKSQKNAVIESIRNIKEAEFIKKNKGFLFAVDAPTRIRYQRIKFRSSEKDNVNYKEFLEQERKEMENKNPNHQNLKACVKIADYQFKNDGTIKELYEKIKKAIKDIE